MEPRFRGGDLVGLRDSAPTQSFPRSLSPRKRGAGIHEFSYKTLSKGSVRMFQSFGRARPDEQIRGTDARLGSVRDGGRQYSGRTRTLLSVW
jgi:hypothetical protein